ncbi:MAG: prepilin-type N-terminal cleavage/methylation domain-containing protein [Syntrophobacteraceae bacterium]
MRDVELRAAGICAGPGQKASRQRPRRMLDALRRSPSALRGGHRTGLFISLSYEGFTLVELLVVLVIIGMAIGLVAPQAFKVYDQAKTYLARLEDGGFKKRAVFEAFLLNKDCDVTYDKGSAVLSCDDKTVLTRSAAQKFDDIHISSKGFTPDMK